MTSCTCRPSCLQMPFQPWSSIYHPTIQIGHQLLIHNQSDPGRSQMLTKQGEDTSGLLSEYILLEKTVGKGMFRCRCNANEIFRTHVRWDHITDHASRIVTDPSGLATGRREVAATGPDWVQLGNTDCYRNDMQGRKSASCRHLISFHSHIQCIICRRRSRCSWPWCLCWRRSGCCACLPYYY